MKAKRLWQTIRLWLIPGSLARTDYVRKHNIYAGIGENVTIMDRKIPLYAKLIRFHNNIRVASNVLFVTHDITDRMLKEKYKKSKEGEFQEVIGCIEILDNVFIGTNTTILSDVRIGPNAIIAAGSVVSRDVPPNSIVGGVPAKVIGNFEDYAEKRRTERVYPEKLCPDKQSVSRELYTYMWKQFKKEK